MYIYTTFYESLCKYPCAVISSLLQEYCVSTTSKRSHPVHMSDLTGGGGDGLGVLFTRGGK